MVAGVVVTAVLWLLMELSAVVNYARLPDDGWTLRGGMYIAMALPALGAIAALLVLGRGRRVVHMDSKGSIFE
jgi:hypothetical protein